MKKRFTIALLGLALILVIACAALGVVAATQGNSRLISIDGLSTASTKCLGPKNTVRSGLQFKLFTTWHADHDLVKILGEYAALGYRPIDSYSQSLEMLPGEPQTYDLIIVQARVLRAVSLSYTPDLSTRITAITALTLCPP